MTERTAPTTDRHESKGETLTHTYEGMFLLDNEVVRKGWDEAKGLVTATLEKHGAQVQTARRWDERLLTYPIRGRRRATYLLTYFNAQGPEIENVRHDLDISEGVLRYLFLSVEEIPEAERGLSEAEGASDFVVPEPPTEDEPEPEPEAPAEEEAKTEGEPKAEAGAEEAKADEAKTEVKAEAEAAKPEEAAPEAAEAKPTETKDEEKAQ